MARYTVDALSLTFDLVSRVAGPDARVESQVDPTAAKTYPLAIVGASAPASVANGPNRGESAAFTMSVRAYSTNRVQASDLCDRIYGGVYGLWRAGTVTPYGWLSRITTSSLQPQQVRSDLEADNVYRFDCVLDVIARH